jgi:hypothetical protein
VKGIAEKSEVEEADSRNKRKHDGESRDGTMEREIELVKTKLIGTAPPKKLV